MVYAVINFKSKKALREAVIAHINGAGPEVRCYQPGLGPDLSHHTGRVALEGPHYPKPHSWYAECELKDGIVVKVK